MVLAAGSLFVTLAVGGALARDDGDASERAGPVKAPRWSVSADAGLGSYGFYPGRPGPSVALDAQARVVRRRVFTLGVGPRLAWASTPNFLHALSVGAVLAPAWTGPRGLTGEIPVTLSYRHVWPDAPTYRVDGSGLTPTPARGSSGAAWGLGASVGYDALPARGVPVAALVGYEATLLAPFLPRSGVPVFMANTVWLKLRVHLIWPGGRAGERGDGRRAR